MTKVTLDAATLAKIPNGDLSEIIDEAGQTIGFFHPLQMPNALSAGRFKSPFTDEEIERRRQQRTGCSLADILERLEKQ